MNERDRRILDVLREDCRKKVFAAIEANGLDKPLTDEIRKLSDEAIADLRARVYALWGKTLEEMELGE